MKEFGEFIEAGLSPIPLKEGEKRPAFLQWQKFCKQQPDGKVIATWNEKYDLDHVGLCLGTPVKDDKVLVAVDVDSDDLIDAVWAAIGDRTAPAKKGKKGVTIFGMATKDIVNTKIKRKLPNGKAAPHPSVEILCSGSQTVVPPSIHPDTGKPYSWVTKSLLDGFPDNLPSITPSVIDEIEAVCKEKGEKFIDLNEMVWLGEGGGGNTHDTCLAAVGLMVSRRKTPDLWTDDEIIARIERAKREACARNGEDYNWPEARRVIQEWIDSAVAKGMEGSSSTKKVPPERFMAQWGFERLGGICNIVCADGVLRHYKDGHWPPVDIGELSKAMLEYSETLKLQEVRNAISIMHTMTERPNFGKTPGVAPRDCPKMRMVCVKNGTLDLRTGKLHPWSADHEKIFMVNCEWDPKAKAPIYEKVRNFTLGYDEKAIATFDEFTGLALTGDTSFHKMMFMIGPGGNGKGTLVRASANLFDPSTISSVSITDLNDERKRTSLVGKLFNVSGEQSRLNVVADTYLKKITGGDPIDIRRLYGETINNVYLTLLFLEMVNEMPGTNDTSDALRRRMIVLNCMNKVIDPDPDLGRKLMEELPGILRIKVEAIQRLYDRGCFDLPESSKEAVDEYMLENDTVRGWFFERVVPVDENDKGTPTGDLYADYREWCERNGHRFPFSNVQWGKRLKNIGYDSIPDKTQGCRVRQLKIRAGLGLPIEI